MAIDPRGEPDFPKFKQIELNLKHLRRLDFRCKGPDN